MVWKVKFAHEAEKDLKALDKQYAKKRLFTKHIICIW